MKLGTVGGLTIALTSLFACSTLFRYDDYRQPAPEGLTLPVESRVMAYISNADWGKYNLHGRNGPDPLLSEGPVLAAGVERALQQVFRHVTTNKPHIRPNLIVKVTDTGLQEHDPVWKGTVKTGLRMTVYDAAGHQVAETLGNSEISIIGDAREVFEAGFFASAFAAAGRLLGTPSLQQLLRNGLPEPDPVASEAFLHSLDLPASAWLNYSAAQPVAAVTAASRFPQYPLGVSFRRGEARADDVAVIVGNADYGRAKDIPDVKPAHADAAGYRRYAVEALGVREENLIVLKDATAAQLAEMFGSEREPRGRLADMVKPGARVLVAYSGHGAPGSAKGKGPYLVPADANGARMDLTGYPLATLYANLALLPASEVTVVLEACFSGTSAAGSVIPLASPIVLDARGPRVPPRLTILAAGAADQVASWERDGSHGLFTKYFLLGMSGGADLKPHGNGDGKVGLDELQAYLKDTLTHFARRYYGRDQEAQIIRGGGN
jgi:hypothetical protein